MEERKTTFTQQEVMERWGLAKRTVIELEHRGILHRLRQLPGVRYRAREVYLAEEVDKEDLKPLAFQERRQYQATINQQAEEIKKLRELVGKMYGAAADVMSEASELVGSSF